MSIFALLLAGIGLVIGFHPGKLHVRNVVEGLQYQDYFEWHKPGDYVLTGEFRSPVDTDSVLLHSSGWLKELTIDGKTFRFPEKFQILEDPPFVLDGLALKKGTMHSYRAKVQVWRGVLGFELYGNPPARARYLYLLGINLVFLAFLLLIARSRGVLIREQLTLLAAFFLRTLYVIKTFPCDRAYDYVAHSSYVKLVMDGLLLPQKCDECSQKPLAYWLAGLSGKLTQPIFGDSIDFQIQLHALALSAVLLFQIYFLIKTLVPDFKRAFWILAPCVFWPEFIIKSSAFSNDLLVYNFWLLLLQLGLSHRRKVWTGAGQALSAVLGFLTKSSFVLVPAAWLMSRSRRISLRALAIGVVIGLNAAWLLNHDAFFSGIFRQIIFKVNPVAFTMPPAHQVDNTFTHAFGFSWRAFFHDPYVENGDDGTGRQFLLAYFFKSSIFSAFLHVPGESPLSVLLARFLIGSSLLLGGGFCAYSLKERKSEESSVLGFQVWIGFLFVGLYRLVGGFAINADARYVLPIFLFMIILLGQEFQRRPGTSLPFRIWAASLSVASIAFFWLLPGLPT